MTNNFNGFKSNVNIELTENFTFPDNIGYAEKHELLSSKARDIRVLFNKEHLYSCYVPKHVFNPYGSLVPRRVVELIIEGTVLLKNRKVVDLGCGCGLIGLAALLMGAEQILFSDINPNVKSLEEHPLLREQDEVKIQDILANEISNTWDTIIACPPSQALDRPVNHDSYESGIFLSGNLIERIIKESSRVLKDGGELFLYVRLQNRTFLDSYALMMLLNQYFDLATMKLLDLAVGKEFPYGDPNTSALFFSISK